MSQLPEVGFVRLKQLLGNPKAKPPIPAIIPISRSALWAAVRSKKFPAPIKLSEHTTVWRVEDVRSYIEQFEKKEMRMC